MDSLTGYVGRLFRRKSLPVSRPRQRSPCRAIQEKDVLREPPRVYLSLTLVACSNILQIKFRDISGFNA